MKPPLPDRSQSPLLTSAVKMLFSPLPPDPEILFCQPLQNSSTSVNANNLHSLVARFQVPVLNAHECAEAAELLLSHSTKLC